MTDEQPPSEPAPEIDGAVSARPQPERYPFWGYHDLLLFAGLAIPCMLLGYGLVKGVLRLFRIDPAMRVVELLPEQFAGYVFLFGALLLIFRMEYGRPFWKSLGWTAPSPRFFWLVVAGLGAAIGAALVGGLLQMPDTSNPMLELMKDPTSVVLVAIFGVSVGPLCEELAFRGFLQPLLVRSFGAIPGILAAAVPFGLLHFVQYGNSWRHVLVIALSGAAFGWMRHTTGSTYASTIMHAAYNMLGFVGLLAQRAGVGGTRPAGLN
jgi:membrane protease YdiL (CAAX protease family)